jgi:hypothetical protein
MRESDLPAQEKPLKNGEAASMVPISKPELVWPGKYDRDGSRKDVPRIALPFQVIETTNESRATREAEKHEGKTLFDLYTGKEGETFEAGWKNKLVWGDNLLVLSSLREKFAGKIDLIYTDPPFDTGSDFTFKVLVGNDDDPLPGKEPSLVEEQAYRDSRTQPTGLKRIFIREIPGQKSESLQIEHSFRFGRFISLHR